MKNRNGDLQTTDSDRLNRFIFTSAGILSFLQLGFFRGWRWRRGNHPFYHFLKSDSVQSQILRCFRHEKFISKFKKICESIIYRKVWTMIGSRICHNNNRLPIIMVARRKPLVIPLNIFQRKKIKYICLSAEKLRFVCNVKPQQHHFFRFSFERVKITIQTMCFKGLKFRYGGNIPSPIHNMFSHICWSTIGPCCYVCDIVYGENALILDYEQRFKRLLGINGGTRRQSNFRTI